MASPLFDPSKMNAAKRAADAPMSVSQAAAALDGAIRRGFTASVRIVGEVGNFTDRTHWYFDIKDEGAVLGCVAFQSVAKRCGVAVKSGLRVVVMGRFELYAKNGRVSLIVEKVEAVGLGSLAERLKALVEELRALGWLDQDRKRPIPRFPRRVAVVTSKTGAALQDVLVTMKRRCPAVGVLVVDVRVQGDAAAAEATAVIRELSRRAAELSVDAVILTRGGGSAEDLWSFNDRELARAIVECSVPVVAAVGHETDTTIAELVADERAATPTQAATRLTPESAALLREVESNEARLGYAVRGMIESMRADVEAVAKRPVLADAGRMVRMREEKLVGVLQRGGFAMRTRLRAFGMRLEAGSAKLMRLRPSADLVRRRERLGALESRLMRACGAEAERGRAAVRAVEQRLRAVSPVSVLERGFSITSTPDGEVVRSVSRAEAGTELLSRVADGTIRSVVGGSSPLPAGELAKPVGRPARRPARKKDEADGPGLFGG